MPSTDSSWPTFNPTWRLDTQQLIRAPQVLLLLTESRSEQRRMPVVFLEVDWGERHHDLCLLDQDGSVLAARRIADGLAGVGELHTLVATHAEEPAQVAVGIETDRGLLVGALLVAGYQVYAVDPQVVSRYRGRHQVSRAKSDRGDAKVLADLVRTDRHNHRPVAGDSPLVEAVKVPLPRPSGPDLGAAAPTRACAGGGRATSMPCEARCGSSTPGRWPRSAPSSPSPRHWRCSSWRRRRSWAGGSPGRRRGGRLFRLVGVGSCRRGWWPSMMRWRRPSSPPQSRSRPLTARWWLPWWPCSAA
jgi:hypothetical protein